jgi:UDP-2,4-diacetamido-2,4,6-trideoxy-beta-L-altropyranose hydrolase
MKALIFTECAKSVGYGHISRCMAIAWALKERGIKSRFFLTGREPIGSLCEPFAVSRLRWYSFGKEVQRALKGVAVAIVDSYLAPRRFYQRLSAAVSVPVYIDDTFRIAYPRGLIVNAAIGAPAKARRSSGRTAVLHGVQYAFLRKEFWKVPRKVIRNNVEDILITCGGSDPRKITPLMVHASVRAFPEARKTVVIGQGFVAVGEIISRGDRRTRFVYRPTATAMKRLMCRSDLALSAGGQTLYELAKIGVPTIAAIVAGNQTQNMRGWRNAGFIYDAGRSDHPSFAARLLRGLEVMRGREARARASATGRRIMRTAGPFCLAQIIERQVNASKG